MLWAQLKGKLAIDGEGLEDLLTSNVFGALKYVPADAGLLPFLSRSVGESADDFHRLLKDVRDVDFDFWPRMEDGCEPDVLLSLTTTSGRRALVLVEAKYRSGKSSFRDLSAKPGSPPQDQLAREWVNCRRRAEQEGAEAFLLFVTADYAFPAQELRDSQQDLEQCGLPAGRLLWLSWRHLARGLDLQSELLRDLQELLDTRYGFREFCGVGLTACRLPWTWMRASTHWPAPVLRWRFVDE